MLEQLIKDLMSLKNPDKAQVLQRFFKTWSWQYGEGDIFLWITVPELRKVSKKYIDLSKPDIEVLLKSEIHEYRFLALAIIKLNFEKNNDENIKKEWFDFSILNLEYINNWDLVDTFVEYVIWPFLYDKEKKLLYELSKSNSLWERRISIISTFDYIRRWEFDDAIKISEVLLQDTHDLIQKAVWWMLREIGKRDEKVLIDFLNKHYKNMPRTMLRYAIEKFDKEKKEYYMKK